MGRNIENQPINESLLFQRNIEIFNKSGITSLLTGLKENVSDLDLNKENPVISSFKKAEDGEFLVLSYMWGNQDEANEEIFHKSLTLMTSIIDEKRIHFMFREVDFNGEKKTESLVVDISDKTKKEEMMEKITLKFSNSLAYFRKTEK